MLRRLGPSGLQRGEGGRARKAARRRSEGSGCEAFRLFVRSYIFCFLPTLDADYGTRVSTLEEWNKPPVEHFNAKFRINNYLIESGVPRTSYVFLSFSSPARLP